MSKLIIIGGVSGTGKSTVGSLLAKALNLPFYDGDDFHPQSNLDKMASGNPLNDEDRKPWLEQLAENLAQWEQHEGAVLGCSALKESYREILSSRCDVDIDWVILTGSVELLTQRLNQRKGHFFDSALLQSQLNTLELPSYGWVITVEGEVDSIVNGLVKKLRP
jgi:6-phosphogluconate dehydrogenase/gluconokinase